MVLCLAARKGMIIKMKEFMKSTYLKAVISVVFMCCIAFSAYDFSVNAPFLNLYSFEKSYIYSEEIMRPLGASLDTAAAWISGNTDADKAREILEKNYAHYYIKIYDNVLTDSSDALDEKSYDVPYGFSIVNKNGEREVKRGFDRPIYTRVNYKMPDADYEIYIRLDDGCAHEAQAKWEATKIKVLSLIYRTAASFLILLLCFVYFVCVCGRKNGYEGLKMLKTDKIYTEVNLAFVMLFGIGTVLLGLFGLFTGFSNESMSELVALTSIGAGILGGITLYFILSSVRNIKNKTFLKNTLIYRIYLFLKSQFKRLEKTFSHKTVKTAGLYLGAYTLIVAVVSKITGGGVIIIACAVVFLCAYLFLDKRFSEFDIIRNEIKELKDGNTAVKTDISKITNVILKETAADLEKIGDGVQKAVDKQIKAERMKSELITNVSHDLKTPLTSIISYSDLLCKEKLTPDEANDYAKIIKDKSLRLKKLTSDLFDMSKVQSGNEKLIKENIDVSLLLSQAVGEADDRIKKSELEFVMNVPEEKIIISADGKKLSRVFENLVINAVKYAMKNTRVYVDLKKDNKKCIIEMKNISSYPLNFDSEEITQRFVRGDISRSTEGNGLGLAIAKSYTEACGGSFKIITDGDLFKARIEFEIL